MTSSSGQKKFLNRRALFKNNAEDVARVDVIMQPDRKRSKIACPASANLQEDECVDTKRKNGLICKAANKTMAKIPSQDQDALLGNEKPPGPPCVQKADKTKSGRALNVQRKKSKKGTSTSSHGRTSRPRDILDYEFMCLSNVENKCDTNTMESERISRNHTKDSCTSSQDSFTDLFASSPASSPINMKQCNAENLDLFSSPNFNTAKCNAESIFDLSDVNDSKLAELDVSGLISSYNSDCQKVELPKIPQQNVCSPKHEEITSNDTSKDRLSYTGIDEDLNFLNHVIPDKKNVSTDILTGNQLDNSRKNDDPMNIKIKNDCQAKETTNELFYGLPLYVGSLVTKHKGIEKLYDWQNDCLNLHGVQQRQNLIYSLPTSGGKTLVAEILIMKELLCHKKDALLILPFVSIVQEKVRDMSLFAVDLEFLVEEYAASKGKFPPRKRRKKKSLYVATIEKANGLVNSLIEEKRLSEIGLVVVDELHMLGEGGQRGATLEMCLAKILFCSSSTQIIGMSATLNNIADLQQFLNAEKYVNDFRPVELKEFIKIENEIYEVKNDRIGRHEEIPLKRFRQVKHQSTDKKLLANDPDHLSVLVQEVIPKYSCLLFCPTKKNCQNVAELLVQNLSRDLKKVKVKEKHELLRALKSNADGLCPVLRRVIPYGIAYHHGGLTMDERKLIEEAYSQGTLCLLTCTSTLAAGVNLPAKRVILRSPYVGMNVISRSQYKQMIGRAGRAGIDTSGESIMLLQQKDKNMVMDLINAPLESCHSSLLHNSGQGLRSLVLSLIGLKVCNTMEDISLFTSKTLLAVQNDLQGNNTLLEKVHENVDALVSLKLVKKWTTTVDGEAATRVEATALGRATFKGCVDVDRSPFIYEEVRRAQESLVLANDLHLLYLVTTPDMIADIQPSWMTYLNQVSSLSTVEQKACEFIGVTEGYLCSKVSGHGSKKNDKEMSVLKRFYLTLMLYKIINEHSFWDVANTFDIPRGFIQSLFSSSTSFASCLVHFTKELPEFHNIRLLLETIVDKLSYTAVLELVPLMQIPGVKKNRAKQLHTAGYRNLQAVANADPNALMEEIEHLPRTQAKLLVSAAKMLLLEKAEALQEEAAELIGT